jgi:signal recognition particle receptor subunit alpha
VGNDGIDQLMKFNSALSSVMAESSYRPGDSEHAINGIFLTKFDTIDDKVGAALSMVYSTGQPILFLGTGQQYTDLKKMNVPTVVNALMK